MEELPRAPGPDEEQQRRTRRFIRWMLIVMVAVAVLVVGLCVAAIPEGG